MNLLSVGEEKPVFGVSPLRINTPCVDMQKSYAACIRWLYNFRHFFSVFWGCLAILLVFGISPRLSGLLLSDSPCLKVVFLFLLLFSSLVVGQIFAALTEVSVIFRRFLLAIIAEPA